MKLNSIRWRLAFSYAAIALLATTSLGFVLHAILSGYYDAQETQYLQERAMQIGLVTAELIEAKVPVQVFQDQSASWSFFLKARVRIEAPNQNVYIDSGVPNNQKVVFFTSALPALPVAFGSSQTAPAGSETISVQIIQDLPPHSTERGDFVVFSPDSVGVAMPADESMYGLFSFREEGNIRRSSQVVVHKIFNEQGAELGTLILSDGPAYGDEILKNVMRGWVIASIFAVLFAALAGWYFSNRITTPILALTQATARMASGDLSARANASTADELGKLGDSFNEMAARVEEMVNTLRSFAADAAHELHTPLTALQTNLELAKDEKHASSLTLYLTRAQEQSQRLESLVKSLLDLSRLESVVAESTFENVNLSQLIHEIAEQFASRAEQSNRIFKLELPNKQIEVNGNEMQLRQVLTNLLENSIKFTRENDAISLSAQVVDNKVQIKVADTGIGIPEEDLQNLFKRFHRGRNVSDYVGNGLGLAIVKAITLGHQGDVTVTSAGIGKGSEFTLTLPTRL